MPIPPDSHYTNRSRHFVRLASGEIVPRAQAENLFAQGRGFHGNYERRQAYRQMKEARRYESDLIEAQRNLQRRGRHFSKREYDNARARLQAEYMRNGNSWRDIDKSPEGALAKYLEETGRRSERAEYDVGDSPSIY